MFLPFHRMLLVGIALAGCATNPYTHRHQLELIPASEERAMGLQAYHQVLSDPKVQISHNPREVEPVERVAARIIEAAKVSMYAATAKQFAWQVSVIKDDKTQNAFALPGGRLRSIRDFSGGPE
jgi:predicted Zn-dependent protease